MAAECDATLSVMPCNLTANLNLSAGIGLKECNDTAGVGCIIANATGIIFNCMGNGIIGNNSVNSRGFNPNQKANVTLVNCTISNYDNNIRANTGSHNFTAYNNTLTNPKSFGLYLFNANGSNIYNNIFRNASLYLSSVGSNTRLTNNKIIGDNNGKSGGTSTTTFGIKFDLTSSNTSGVTIDSNNLTSFITAIYILDNSVANYITDVSIINNYVANSDKAILINSLQYPTLTYNANVSNNILNNITANYDYYDVGIKIINSSFINVNNNSIKEAASAGILVQKSTNVTITNNNFSFIPLNLRSLYLANDVNEPITAIVLAELYKTWLGDGTESVTDGLTKIIPYASSNITIASNIYDNNTQVYIKSQNTTNLVYDISGYWYRKYQVPTNLQDPIELFVNPSFNSLSNYAGKINNILHEGYMNPITYSTTDIRKVNISFSNTSMVFKNINNTNDYNVSVFSAKRSSVYNMSSGTRVLLTNINDNGQYNYTLNPNNSIEINNCTYVSYNYDVNETTIICSYDLFNTLVYNISNVSYCGSSLCSSSSSITVNDSYILNNFNVTESVQREYSPMYLTGTAASKTLSSNITDSIASVPVIMTVTSCGDRTNNGNLVQICNPGSCPDFICLDPTTAYFTDTVANGNTVYTLTYSSGKSTAAMEGINAVLIMLGFFGIIAILVTIGLLINAAMGNGLKSVEIYNWGDTLIFLGIAAVILLILIVAVATVGFG